MFREINLNIIDGVYIITTEDESVYITGRNLDEVLNNLKVFKENGAQVEY